MSVMRLNTLSLTFLDTISGYNFLATKRNQLPTVYVDHGRTTGTCQAVIAGTHGSSEFCVLLPLADRMSLVETRKLDTDEIRRPPLLFSSKISVILLELPEDSQQSEKPLMRIWNLHRVSSRDHCCRASRIASPSEACRTCWVRLLIELLLFMHRICPNSWWRDWTRCTLWTIYHPGVQCDSLMWYSERRRAWRA